MFPANGSLNRLSTSLDIAFSDRDIPLDDGYTYSLLEGNLFTKEISLDDIAQTNIGDCYLLSALQALVLRDPDYIYRMISFNPLHNNVWVALYYDDMRYIIQVQATIFNRNENIGVEQNAPWVQIIEKAYAAVTATYKKNLWGKTLLKILASGHTDQAFDVLLGCKSRRYAIIREQIYYNNDSMPDIRPSLTRNYYNYYRKLYLIFKEPRSDEEHAIFSQSLDTVFCGNLEVILNYKAFMIRNQNKVFSSVRKKFILIRNDGAVYFKILRQEDILSLFHDLFRGQHEILRMLNAYVRAYFPVKRGRRSLGESYRSFLLSNFTADNIRTLKSLLPGNLSPALVNKIQQLNEENLLYRSLEFDFEEVQALQSFIMEPALAQKLLTSSNQTLTYFAIESALQQGRLVCVGTHHEDNTEVWRSELAYKGLRPNHGYTVLGCFINQGRKFLLLSNPHYANYPRTYYLHARPSKVNVLSTTPSTRFNPFYRKTLLNTLTGINSSSIVLGVSVGNLSQPGDLLRNLISMPSVFPVEMSDITNKFSTLYISGDISATQI